jgi:hypothetical protein
VTGNDAGKGTLVAALAEAAFLVGLEKNRLLYALISFFFPSLTCFPSLSY